MRQIALIGTFLLSVFTALGAQVVEKTDERIDRLSQLTPEVIHDSIKVLLNDINVSEDSISDNHFGRIHGIVHKIKDPEIRIKILNDLALYDSKHYFEYLREVILISRKHDLKKDQFWALNTIAYYYKSANKLDSAMVYGLRARDLIYYQDVNGEISIKLLIADLHFWARLYDKAEQLYKEVLELKGDSAQFHDWIFTTTSNNLGMIELNRREFDKARSYFNSSLKFRTECKITNFDSVSLAYTYYLLGKTELEYGDSEKARNYYNLGAPIAEKIHVREFRFYFTLLNARILFSEEKTNIARTEVWKAFSLLDEEDRNFLGQFESKPQIANDILQMYDLLIYINAKEGYSDSTLYYYNLHKELGNRLELNTSYSAYIQMMAENDFKIVSTLLRKAREQRKIVLAGFTLVILLLIFLLEYTRRIRNIRKQLSEKQSELLKINENLERTTNELTLSNIAKDRFFSVLAHDLKNPFSAMKGFNELLDESLNLNNLKDSKTYASIIRNSTDIVYDLLINLLEWSKIHSGHISFSSESVSVESLFKETVQRQEFQASYKKISLKYFTEPDSYIICDKNMMLTILRNILANAIKATPEKGNILLKYNCTEDYHTISLKDTGCGMTTEKIDQVFGIKDSMSAPEERYEGDSGLGMIIVKDFLNHHMGSLKVISEPGAGTEVLIIIPVKILGV